MTERRSKPPRAWRESLVSRDRVEEPNARAEIERVVIDVSLPDERGLVTLSLREGVLVAVDDAGRREGPLVAAAIAWLTGLSRERASDVGGSRSDVRSDVPGARTSLAPPAPSGRALDAARELALALVRSGLAGARRGALDEQIRRARSADDPRVARWAARIEQAIRAEDLALVGQLAGGVLSTSTALPTSRVELGLVEVAREHLDAARPRSIERRHLFDLTTGAHYVEDLEVGARAGSVGPCPRTLEVGLAEVSDDGGHAAIRVLQYTTSSKLAAITHARLRELALREMSRVFEHVERVLSASPAFAEPVVLVEITRWDEGLSAMDASGASVPWSRDEDPAACARLAEVVREHPPRLVVLRAVPRRGAHAFVPLACVVERAGELDVLRLRG